MSDLNALKHEIFNYVTLRLANGIIDVELDPEHLEVAYQRAIGTYRQRSQNSSEESYAFLELIEHQNTYILPKEVTHVRQVFRRTIGDSVGPYSSSFDPFSQAALNVYLLNFSYSGGIATYELYTQYVELAARMFGGYVNYTFNPSTKELRIVRDPKGSGETLLLWTYNQKPEVQLLTNPSTSQWIKDFTFSASKEIIGEARGKFASIAGPQAGTALNGQQLKSEAATEIAQLIDDLRNYVDGSQPLYFIIG